MNLRFSTTHHTVCCHDPWGVHSCVIVTQCTTVMVALHFSVGERKSGGHNIERKSVISCVWLLIINSAKQAVANDTHETHETRVRRKRGVVARRSSPCCYQHCTREKLAILSVSLAYNLIAFARRGQPRKGCSTATDSRAVSCHYWLVWFSRIIQHRNDFTACSRRQLSL